MSKLRQLTSSNLFIDLFPDFLLIDIGLFLTDIVGLNTYYHRNCVFSQNGWRLLIPSKIKKDSRVAFTEVVCVQLAEIYANWDFEILEAIASKEVPRPSWIKDEDIAEKFFIFLADKMVGIIKSFRVGNSIFTFFHTGKLTPMQIKHYVYKILGNLFIIRGEKIIESTISKIGKRPYGYLKELADFFLQIGYKLLSQSSKL